MKKKEKKLYDPMRDAESMMKVQSQGGKTQFWDRSKVTDQTGKM